MIGWRPFLLTAVAIALFALVGFDVSATDTKSGSCAAAQKLTDAHYFYAARQAYAGVLRQHPRSTCAINGLNETTSEQCARFMRIAVADPSEAHKQLLAIAEQDPAPAPDSCVWADLKTTAASTASK